MNIPDDESIKRLWQKYQLPQMKQRHSTLVAAVAGYLATEYTKATNKSINIPLVKKAALLHDIDKNIPRLPGEMHPDTSVRILHEEGLHEIAEVVRTHPLHAILDAAIAPQTLEQKILYLSDKMVKWDIITVDERFRLWREESLPESAYEMLDKTYPHVKVLESEIFSVIRQSPEDIKNRI